MTQALREAIALLRCPHCGDVLRHEGSAVRCPAGHAFDVARQGYLNLLPGGARAGTADTSEMVAARAAFLAAGHYRPLAEALARAVKQGPLLDVGGGPGYYAAHLLDALPVTSGLTMDLSVPASRRAARAHPRLAAVAADAWQPWPVLDAVFGTVLSVFAPRAPAEALRVLAPGGVLVVATPTPAHLEELVGELNMITVDPTKPARLATQLSAFTPVAAELVEDQLHLTADEVATVVAMGPSAHHRTQPATGRRWVTLSVQVTSYAPRVGTTPDRAHRSGRSGP